MIVVHARGNSKIGIGNLSRAYELVSYLQKDLDVIGIFECDEILSKKYQNKNVFISSSIQTSLDIIKEKACKIYISDLVSPSKKLSDDLRRIGIKKIFHFNDLLEGFEPDVLFVTDGFDYKVEYRNIKIYRGFNYYIVGQKILEKRPKVFKATKNIKNILISFGGADPAFYTEYFTKIINPKDKYNYTIVLGPAMDKKRKEEIQSIKKDNVKYLDSPTNMSELLVQNDLLVTLGGMTTYEAMCLGTPASAIRWSYLEYIVKSFGEKSMVNDLGSIEEAYKNLLELDINEVNKKAKNAFDIINGSALNNIKFAILKETKNL